MDGLASELMLSCQGTIRIFPSIIPLRLLYPDWVIRYVITALCALALAFGPAASGGALAAPAAVTAHCEMDSQKMPSVPAGHPKMKCCTPACQIAASAALIPDRGIVPAHTDASGTTHDPGAVKELTSVCASGLDPPPRLQS